MERRLLNAIMTPAMVGSLDLGLWLAVEGGFLAGGCRLASAKFLLVVTCRRSRLPRLLSGIRAAENRGRRAISG